jgi:hypothetical protein
MELAMTGGKKCRPYIGGIPSLTSPIRSSAAA